MILFVYNVLLMAGLVVTSPWWLWRMATTRKYREGLRERLGWTPGRLGGDGRPVVWVHAVSVGEVLAVSRLVAELDRALSDYRLLISTTTRTGQALARERFGRDRVFYCPLDLPWATGAYLKGLNPRLLVLAETEFWPNLLTGCFRREIPIAVVNARVSDRSWPRYRALRRWWGPILSRLSLVLAQTEVDAERLRAIGCDPARVRVAGNLKFDVRAAAETEATRLLKSLAPGPRFVVAGSTLDGEEQALLDAWPEIQGADPSLVLVVAARHPERFGAVAALLERSGLPWVRRSAWKAGETAPEWAPGQVILLDTIGVLASVYSLAAVAFVGGSLVPAGGHNPLEPAQFAVPIVMGPNYVNFRAVVEELRAHDALRIAGREELARAILELLGDRTKADAMGQRARRVFEEQAGATGRCVEAIRGLLGGKADRPA
jgi:3-deoxy-D-manno-octulosonic-acid transferase